MQKGVIVAALLLAGAAKAEAPAQMPGWMAGCWEQKDGARWTEECWTIARAGMMMGSGRSGTGETVRDWEVSRIERAAESGMTFWGSPKGASPVAFPMVSQSATEIVFANPGHDYPQRIRYWREGEELLAEISLMDGSKPFRWRYRRMG